MNILSVSKLQKEFNGEILFKNISFEIMEGEILGFAGVEGNGQTELVEVITGLRPASSGKIFLYDQDITNYSPRNIREDKIAHIPEDRRQRGIILNYTVAENSILGSHYRSPFNKGLSLNFPAINNHAINLQINSVKLISNKGLCYTLIGGNRDGRVELR